MRVRVFRPLLCGLLTLLLMTGSVSLCLADVVGPAPLTEYDYTSYYLLPGPGLELMYTTNAPGDRDEFTLHIEVPENYVEKVSGKVNIYFYDPECMGNLDESASADAVVTFELEESSGDPVDLIAQSSGEYAYFDDDDYDESWSGMYYFEPTSGQTYVLRGFVDGSNASRKNRFRIAIGPIFPTEDAAASDGDTAESVSALSARGGGSQGGGGSGGMPEDKGPDVEHDDDLVLPPVLKVFLGDFDERLMSSDGESIYFVELPAPEEPAPTGDPLDENDFGQPVDVSFFNLSDGVSCLHMVTGEEAGVTSPDLTINKELFPYVGVIDYLAAISEDDGHDTVETASLKSRGSGKGGKPDDHDEEDVPPPIPSWGLVAVHVQTDDTGATGTEWSLKAGLDTETSLLMPIPPYILAPKGISASLWRWYFDTALTTILGEDWKTGGNGHPRQGGGTEPHIREGTVPSPDELFAFLKKVEYAASEAYFTFPEDDGDDHQLFDDKLGSSAVAEKEYFTFGEDMEAALEDAWNILSFHVLDSDGEWGDIEAKDPQVRCRVQMFSLMLSAVWHEEIFNRDDTTEGDHAVDDGSWDGREYRPWVFLPESLVRGLWGEEKVDEGYYLKSMKSMVNDFLEAYATYGKDETKGLFHFLEILNELPVGWYPLQVPTEVSSCGG